MRKIFDDGILEATLYPNDWIYVRWVQNKHGRLQKSLIKDLDRIERNIWRLKLKGWFTDSEVGHRDFHKLLLKYGAVPSGLLGKHLRFAKPIMKEGDIHVWKRTVSTETASIS